MAEVFLRHTPLSSGPLGADGKPLIYPNAPAIVVTLSLRLRSYS